MTRITRIAVNTAAAAALALLPVAVATTTDPQAAPRGASLGMLAALGLSVAALAAAQQEY